MINNNKIIYYIIVLLICISCQRKIYTKELTRTYKNGKKEVYQVKNDSILHGKLVKYYKSGNKELESIYKDGKRIDSTIYYYDSNKNDIEAIRYWLKDDFSEYLSFTKKHNIISKGSYKGDIKIGNWYYYRNNKLYRVIEYKNINDETYLNQDWFFNNKGDTLNQGSHMQYKISSDTINLGEAIEFYFWSTQPIMPDYYSDYAVVISKHSDKNFNYNFSNETTIVKDTIPSFKYDGIDHSDIPKNIELNKHVRFQATISQKGEYNFRGYFAQFIKTDSITIFEAKTPVNFKVRKIYFDIPIYIKDTVE
jgi:hypothetical protein